MITLDGHHSKRTIARYIIKAVYILFVPVSGLILFPIVIFLPNFIMNHASSSWINLISLVQFFTFMPVIAFFFLKIYYLECLPALATLSWEAGWCLMLLAGNNKEDSWNTRKKAFFYSLAFALALAPLVIIQITGIENIPYLSSLYSSYLSYFTVRDLQVYWAVILWFIIWFFLWFVRFPRMVRNKEITWLEVAWFSWFVFLTVILILLGTVDYYVIRE